MDLPRAFWEVLLRPGTGIQLVSKVAQDGTEQWLGSINIQRGDEIGRVAVQLTVSAVSGPSSYINDIAASASKARNRQSMS